ncbi:DUF4157 domain-containing protein [Streptomyces sp. NRRL WC-3549]|uniref:eCIS core domain-containing protein n=1 Tax=Streptomyces sp. NRRL WC-3549 TaxID=1463925 RepID=UPI0007C68FB0
MQRSVVHDVLRSRGEPLDAATRSDMEDRLEADFSDVRVHSDSAARASAAEVGARAYTSGNHIVIGDGGSDRHTLAHELTHVIQQRQGPVAGTDNGAGLRVSDPGDRFEREAEANATRALSRAPQSGPKAAERRPDGARAASEPCVQRTTRSATGSLPLTAWDRFRPVWATEVYGPSDRRTGGTSVRVTLGPSVNAPGNTYGGSPPGAAECTLVNELNQRDGSGWIKGHLWNDNLGGPGVSANLTAMTSATNSTFNRQFEEPLKRMLHECSAHARNNTGAAHWYGVEISVRTYGRLSANPADLEFHVPDGVEHTAHYVQMDRASQAISRGPANPGPNFPAEIH